MKKPVINIGVTGLNAIDSPGPGVAVIRGLREAGSFDVRIIGFAYESLEPGIYMHDLVDRTYQIPYPSTGTDALLSRLEYIHSREKLDVIIPNFDAELYSFMKLESKLLQMGIHMFLPTMEQFEERHKVNLSEFGKKYGIDVPLGKAIFDSSEIFDLQKDFDFPLMVKGKWYDAYIAYNMEQARTYFNKISAKWGLPVVLQRYVHGTEYNVTGLGDGKGNTIAAVPMRKQFITDKGKAWAGISIDDKKLLSITQKFISATKWKGAFELEMMKSNDNKYYLMEINPRIPAWVYLAVGVGQNIPEALTNLAMGNEVAPFESYEVGKLFIRYSYDMIVDRSEFEKISMNGEL
ncbi:MAG: biotin carboxylase [Bacteroidetes bacterium HGW-Bacteroidetes-9]|jgi:carbamoyl-phosphate synthase large subunit|nr:MAG: biotin carboxylase [Bacteroidetes bacterium HGW-Bacteroidetes-9]